MQAAEDNFTPAASEPNKPLEVGLATRFAQRYPTARTDRLVRAPKYGDSAILASG